MLFNSISFLFLFFPLVTLAYFALPHRFRWALLLGASCYFYMAFIPIYILILAITILIDYFAGIWIEDSAGEKRRKFLVFSILSTVLVLVIFKYYNFFATDLTALAHLIGWNYSITALHLILPIGLSFHTFQSLSYVIEVYRGHQKAERNFGIYSLYVMFYPQLVAGPIERPQNLLHQFREKHEFEYQRVADGLRLMLWGLFKKVVVADRLSIYVDAVYGNVGQHNGLTLAVATVFFAFQIYCDFSGYSDMAIGAARVMGFNLMMNFNRPYFSKSISEFWKRWHISLSTWFRDYVYLPLGGNRVVKWKWFRNLLVTFTLSGFWHGANWTYIIWGALNGFFLVGAIVTEPARQRLAAATGLSSNKSIYMVVKVAITFALTCCAWVFFRAANLEDAVLIYQKFLFSRGPLFTGGAKDLIYGVCGIFCVLAFDYWTRGKPFDVAIATKGTATRWAVYLFLLMGLLTIGVFDASQFIYFQF
jgi:alginate O-acetyltransferase complex protein AlgI